MEDLDLDKVVRFQVKGQSRQKETQLFVKGRILFQLIEKTPREVKLVQEHLPDPDSSLSEESMTCSYFITKKLWIFKQEEQMLKFRLRTIFDKKLNKASKINVKID